MPPLAHFVLCSTSLRASLAKLRRSQVGRFWDRIAAMFEVPRTEGLETREGKSKEVPEPGSRPTIEFIIEEIRTQEWYSDQIAFERTAPEKIGRLGMDLSLDERHKSDSLVHSCS